MTWMPWGPDDPASKFVEEWVARKFPKLLIDEGISIVTSGRANTATDVIMYVSLNFGADLLRFQAHEISEFVNDLIRTFRKQS